jgi:hypothetical protein
MSRSIRTKGGFASKKVDDEYGITYPSSKLYVTMTCTGGALKEVGLLPEPPEEALASSRVVRNVISDDVTFPPHAHPSPCQLLPKVEPIGHAVAHFSISIPALQPLSFGLGQYFVATLHHKVNNVIMSLMV